MVKTFEQFLKSVRKKNGDKILPSTIERYTYFVEEYQKEFSLINSVENLIVEMNRILKTRPSIVMYSAFRMYLLYIGIDKKDIILKTLEVPETNASAFKSKRFLQSKVLSKGELRAIFEQSTPFEQLIFSALYDTGCRRQELLNIKHKDIYFKDNPEDNVYAEVSILGKGAKSRIVYFGKTTVKLLKNLVPNLSDNDYVFVLKKDNGEPYASQSQALYYMITIKTKKVLERQISTHALRHTKMTHLADEGADVLGIKNYAGHEDIKTTMVYIEISKRMGKIAFKEHALDIAELEGV